LERPKRKPLSQSQPKALRVSVCSADGSTHTESNNLYREVKHRYRPNLSPRQRPKRVPIRQRSRRRQRRGEPHTEPGLGVLLASLWFEGNGSLIYIHTSNYNSYMFKWVAHLLCDAALRFGGARSDRIAVRGAHPQEAIRLHNSD